MVRRATVIASAVVLLLIGCGGDDERGAATTAANNVRAPIIVDINALEGMTVAAPQGATIDITGDDSTFADWTANIAVPSVVSFTPGRVDASAQFNPGLSATAPGTSEVTLTNSTSGETVTFTVEVSAS